MKYIYYILIVSTCFIVQNTASAQGFTRVSDTAGVIKKIAETANSLQTIKSDFVQVKNLSVLSEKVVSKGTFYFKQSKVRLEYNQPFKYLMVINGSKIHIQDDARSTQVDMHKNKLFQEINNIIVGCVSGNIAADKDFSIHFYSSADQLKLEMTPVKKGLSEYFKTIEIYISRKDYSVNRIEMNETSGDNTSISFTNKVINGAIADNLFAVN